MIGGATKTRHSRLSISEDEQTACTRNFTPLDDAVILQQPVTGIGVNTLATMLRTSREMLICRAGQLGVSLDISDEVAETRVFSCRDKRLVDPLLERLKQIHGDRT
jgi:hypothetical protein